MLKKFFICMSVFVISANAKYVTMDKIDKDKKSIQVSSCETRVCINITHSQMDTFDYITIKENGYFATYVVNIDKENEEEVMSSLRDKFPDMILRKKYTDNKELYSLKAYDEDFYINKNYISEVKTKSIALYKLPIHTSEIIDRKDRGDTINIDGCNEFEWCKQKDKKAYLPLYRVDLKGKQKIPVIEKGIQKKEIIKNTPNKDKKNKTLTKEVIDEYKIALTLYKNKKYEESYQAFDKLFNDIPNDPNINFYLGRSAFETGKYHESIVAYERVLFEKPDSSRVKLEMARSYIATESYKEAKNLLNEVKEDKELPANVAQVLNAYLAIIDEKEAKHFISGILMAGINYDSNVNSRAKHGTFDNVYFSSFDTYLDLSNTTEDETTVYHQEIALVNYAYKISDTIRNKHDFMLFYKSSFENTLNPKDVKMFTYTPAISVQYDEKLNIDYALYFDYMWIGGADYIKTYALLPKFTYIHSETDTFTGQFKYQNKFNQVESSKSKDSIYVEALLSMSHVYSQTLTLSPSVTLIDEEKKSGITEGVDYSGIKLALASSYIYAPTLILSPSASINISRYEGQDSSYLVQQLNREFKVAMSATYVYSPEWIFQGATDYTYQTSSMQSEEYDKYTISVNVIRPF